MHNAAAERFEMHVEDKLAFAAYSIVDRNLFLAYTEIPDALAERGVDRTLMRGAFEYARARGMSVVPICPTARAFLEQEPEFRILVREGNR